MSALLITYWLGFMVFIDPHLAATSSQHAYGYWLAYCKPAIPRRFVYIRGMNSVVIILIIARYLLFHGMTMALIGSMFLLVIHYDCFISQDI